ncbi:hypothetical protein BGZ63DRAFT_409212 [Mariannaea sp. PMI_226]|nr:hypothetical protein BGZ63DRAFT_409212 [Mariannaea sp. PMI_226]
MDDDKYEVYCQRLFSKAKLSVTDQRGSMNTETLTSLGMPTILGQELFDSPIRVSLRRSGSHWCHRRFFGFRDVIKKAGGRTSSLVWASQTDYMSSLRLSNSLVAVLGALIRCFSYAIGYVWD